MRFYFPYSPLYISGDDAGNALRQKEADRINATTDRSVDTREIVNRFTYLLRREKLNEPTDIHPT